MLLNPWLNTCSSQSVLNSSQELESKVEKMPREITAGSLSKSDFKEWSRRVYGKQEFAGAGKTNAGLLVPLERRLAKLVLPLIPRWLVTYPLTRLEPELSSCLVGFRDLFSYCLRWVLYSNMML